jgi:mercuric reductase
MTEIATGQGWGRCAVTSTQLASDTQAPPEGAPAPETARADMRRGSGADGDHFDIIVLGSGATAFGVALRASELGASVAMTEARTIGGTCVNRGCLPSKNLIEAARLFHDAHQPRYPGLLPRGMGLDFAALVRQKDEVVEYYRDHKYTSIIGPERNITIIEGHASFLDEHTVQVGERRLTADRFVIATGSRPNVPPIEGLDDVPYLTSDLLTVGEGLELTELPKSLIVIGSGYIALELGQMLHRFGSEVTLLERGPAILRGYEPVIGETLLQILRDEGLGVRTNATTKRVRRDGDGVVVTIVHHGMERELRAEQLLVATGRIPNTEELGLDKVGVETDERGWIRVDGELRTTSPTIWAAGDVIGLHTGSQMATPVGVHDGATIAHNAIGGEHRTADHRVIPRVIFTDPQLAVVGITEAQAEAQGIDCRCQEVPMEFVPRAGAIHDTRGVIKMVAERATGRVLGVSMLGRDAGEVIHEAAMGMRFGATIDDFIDLVHVYPTMAEALKIAAIAFYKDPATLSCCAS